MAIHLPFTRPVRNIPLPPLVQAYAKPMTLFVMCRRHEAYHTWNRKIMCGVVLSIEESPFVPGETWYYVALSNGGYAHVPPSHIRILGVQEAA